MTKLPKKISKSFALDSLKDGDLEVFSPVDGRLMATLKSDMPSAAEEKIATARQAFEDWRVVPPPVRGELIRLFGQRLRDNKDDLAQLVTLECGKIISEAGGEVQEMIDICDFAVGLSRQLYGLTIASERPGHHLREMWHPLGVVGVISAFNFPVAVWAWNFALAIVCGNSVIWKPSEKTPLTALACQRIWQQACQDFAEAHPMDTSGLSQLLIGDALVGEAMVRHPGVNLVSATGSVPMGRAVNQVVAARLGRSLLELGGNNAMIVAPSADLEMAERAILFAAVGTAGQRCTTLRRLIVHEDINDKLVSRLIESYKTLPIGNPLEDGTLVGPLIDRASYEAMQEALEKARADGGKVMGGERVLEKEYPGAYYVKPAIVQMPGQTEVVQHETFAPIMYVLRYDDLDEAIALQNGVPQGLSSAIFTMDVREAERFTSASGSDCGIVNVNIGPSGAEIGGAFGGEKETGGGRESGSDSWKIYMRRATITVNYSADLPLAQGVKFS